MPEFDITEWSDFVRGVCDPETEERMRTHLASKSSPSLHSPPSGKTHNMVAALRRVAAVGRRDAEHPVPEHAVWVAKAIGSLRRPSDSASPRERGLPFAPFRGDAPILRRLPFMLTFDNLHQAASAGTRDIQSFHRHLVFEAEGYSVDVRWEHDMEPPGTVVVGQVLSCGGGALPLGGIPILVVSGERIVGRASTGDFGEFQVESLPREAMNLCVLVGPEECLELPLATEAE